MNKLNLNLIIGVVLLSVISVAVSLVALSRTGVKLGALPTYNNFQLLSPMGFGAYMSNGIATSSPTASSSPTVKTLVATSTIQLTSAAAGCAQFDSSGTLASTGANCAAISTAKTIDFYAATSSINDTSATLRPATTTSIATGQSMMIWASCTMPNNNTTVTAYLDVHNPGGGTTTISVSEVAEAGNDNNKDPLSFNGVYTATTTGNLFIAIDTTRFTGLTTSCTNYNFSYLRFTN